MYYVHKVNGKMFSSIHSKWKKKNLDRLHFARPSPDANLN